MHVESVTETYDITGQMHEKNYFSSAKWSPNIRFIACPCYAKLIVYPSNRCVGNSKCSDMFEQVVFWPSLNFKLPVLRERLRCSRRWLLRTGNGVCKTITNLQICSFPIFKYCVKHCWLWHVMNPV